MNVLITRLGRFTFTVLMIIFTSACSDGISDTSGKVTLDVYKTPSCGCCGDWVAHINDNGFAAKIHNQNSLEKIKNQYKIPAAMQSCHTGISAQGYFFEGHIPAKFVTQFLNNPPQDAVGLAVPGMPVGSPGMEIEDQFDPYSILLIKKDGGTEVYATISSIEEQF